MFDKPIAAEVVDALAALVTADAELGPYLATGGGVAAKEVEALALRQTTATPALWILLEPLLEEPLGALDLRLDIPVFFLLLTRAVGEGDDRPWWHRAAVIHRLEQVIRGQELGHLRGSDGRSLTHNLVRFDRIGSGRAVLADRVILTELRAVFRTTFNAQTLELET